MGIQEQLIMHGLKHYVVHFHISDKLAKKIVFKPNIDESKDIRWVSCNNPTLYGDHSKFIKLAQLNCIKNHSQNIQVITTNSLLYSFIGCFLLIAYILMLTSIIVYILY